jgi:hypothetical protein
MVLFKNQKYLSLKEAAKIFGYSPDYIGCLIRKGKIKGKKVYSNISWQIDKQTIIEYCRERKREVKNLDIRDNKYFSLKEAAKISGYAPDYIGYLIRKGKIKGKKISNQISWLVSREEIERYQKLKNQKLLGRKSIGQFPIFSFSWRLALAIFIIFSLISELTPLAPIKFLQSSIGAFFIEETKTVNFYTSLSTGDWQNPQNAQGPPDIRPTGDINSFSETNSAIYKNGSLHLISENFTTDEDFTNYNFQSTKIKFSFAFGEKKPDFQIIEEGTTTIESGPTSFWNKVKNFFSSLFTKFSLIAKAEEQGTTTAIENIENEILDNVTPTEIIEATTTEEVTTTEATPVPNVSDVGTGQATTSEIATTTESLPNLDTKIIIWWSLDGQNWQKLNTISDYPLSNKLNGGYFELDAPFLKNWNDVENLKIKFEGAIGGETNLIAYLDSVWVEAEYQQQETSNKQQGEKVATTTEATTTEATTTEATTTEATTTEATTTEATTTVATTTATSTVEKQKSSKPKIKIKDNSLLINLFEKSFPADEEPTFEIKEPEINLQEIIDTGKGELIEGEIISPNIAEVSTTSIATTTEATTTEATTTEATTTEATTTEATTTEATTTEATTTETTSTIEEVTSTISLSILDILEETTTTEATTTQSEIATTTEATTTESTTTETTTTEATTTEATSTEAITPETEFTPILTIKIFDPQGIESQIQPQIFSQKVNGKEKFEIKLPKERNFKPGKWKMEIELETEDAIFVIEEDFTWGVLAINVNKSIYISNQQQATSETAYIQMAVLDDSGHTICDANLKLEIISPTSSTTYPQIQKSGECGPNNVTNVPDYFAYYQVGEPGVYQMILTQMDTDGNTELHRIEDSFEVRESVPFDVERIGPTRIWPIAAYEMTLKIKVNQDFEGVVKEYVPEGFEITSDNLLIYEINRIDESIKVISWNVDWKAGETYELKYQFDAPDVSPYLYLLGPLSFVGKPLSTTNTDTNNHESVSGTSSNISENLVFKELRSWQIAADVAGDVILFWNGNTIPTGWTCISCLSGDAFYGVFPRASSTYAAATSSDNTHTHAATFQSATQAAGIYNFNAGALLPADSHTHSWADFTTSAGDHQPPFKNLKFIKANNPSTLPNGIIGIFDVASSSLPANWTYYTPLDGLYLRGENSTTTGGSLTHNHTGGSQTSGASNNEAKAGTGNSWTIAAKNHTHTLPSDTTANATNTPPFVTVVFAQLTATSSIPDGLIAMFDNTSLPTNWSIVSNASPYLGNFLKGADSSGITGGTSTHTHLNLTITSAGPSATTSAKDYGVITYSGSSQEHTHNVTFSFNTKSSLPTYRDVILGKYTAPVPIIVSGKVYENEGVTPLLTGPTLKLAINGTSTATTTASTTDGSYTFTGVVQPSAGDVFTIFIDGTSTKAVTVDRYYGSGNATNIDLYQNRIIVRHDDSGPITISDLDMYDSVQDPDILYTASSTAGTLTASSTSEFFVWSGKTFGAWGTGGVGGEVSLADVDINGTSTATSTQTISVSGNWDATGGTFNSASSTVQFTATSAKNITTNGSPFWNLTFNGSGGVWTFQDAATTTNDLQILAGTASSTFDFYVKGGDVTGDGTLNFTGGTFFLYGTGYFGGANPWTFYHLTFGSGTAGTTTATSTVSATTTVSGNLTVTSNQTLTGSKSFTINGGNATGDGTINLTGTGTFTLAGTGNFGGTSNWTFYNLTFGSGSAASTTAPSSGTTTVSNVLTISANQQLYAGSKPWVLSGSGTPFKIDGIFQAQSSLFKYIGICPLACNIYVSATTYNNLQIGFEGEEPGLETYVLATTTGETLTTNGYFYVGNGTYAANVTANVNDPTLNIIGDFEIRSGATFTASNSATSTFAGNWSNSGTFTHSNGTVTFDAPATGRTIDSGGTTTAKTFYNINFNNSSGGWTFTTSTTIVNNCTTTAGAVTSTSGTLYVGGNWYVASSTGIFRHNNGEVLFNATSSGHTITDGGWPFYKITFNGTGGEWLYKDSTSTAPATTTVIAGTPTFLNAKTGAVVVTGGTLNVDWYLGIHVVAEDSTSTDLANATSTVSEVTGSSTVWKMSSGSWGTAATSQISVTGSDGKNPQPNSDGAIRIREYQRTSSATTTYKYNLAIVPPAGFVSYDYHSKTGYYVVSTLSGESGNCISQNWHRVNISQVNGVKDYSGLNQPPQYGTWYCGMTSDLQFSLTPGTVSLDLLQSNDFTATGTITLSATTSYPNGFIVKAHMADTLGALATTTSSTTIIRFPHNNDSPAAWNATCNASSTCCGFGYTTNDSSLPGSPTDRFTNPIKWAGFATSSLSTDPVATGNPDGDSYIVTLKASVSSNQEAGKYTGTIYFIATANY